VPKLELDASVEVLIDKIQVQQVLLNLLRNAFEAMERVERRVVTISAAAVDASIIVFEIERPTPMP
jgi:two-component system, LuxR family, sensor kinase FixL